MKFRFCCVCQNLITKQINSVKQNFEIKNCFAALKFVYFVSISVFVFSIVKIEFRNIKIICLYCEYFFFFVKVFWIKSRLFPLSSGEKINYPKQVISIPQFFFLDIAGYSEREREMIT